MFTALLLAKGGVGVKIIDQEEGTAGESYACALHSQTLQIFEQVGLASEVLALSNHVGMVAFYEQAHRRAEVHFSEPGRELPSTTSVLATLPQSALEEVLERKLRQERNVTFLWHHRLTDLQQDEETVVATINKLEETAKGYMVPEWETVVQKTLQTRASFVVGADGHHSHVRQCLGIEYEEMGRPEKFVTFEFGADFSPHQEARIVLDDFGTSALWPLPRNKWRWTFQLANAEEGREFPLKDRSHLRFEETQSEHDSLHHLRSLIQARAPWFTCNVAETDWQAEVKFERRLAKRFGIGRCWLAGDAAHRTSPIAAQSMNVGLRDAVELSRTVKSILHEHASLDLFEGYHRERHSAWSQLFGLANASVANQLPPGWVKDHCSRLLPCIPASGGDLLAFMKRARVQ
jgi:2-polyprenyl-6-methoxyphenol hydroxylase-like FAD-dependent oxidoreductase